MMSYEDQILMAKRTLLTARVVRDLVRDLRKPAQPKKPSEPPPLKKTKRKAAERPHAKWRRITGITLAIEDRLSIKARRAGIRRLIHWIERKWAETPIQNSEFKIRNCDADNISITRTWTLPLETWRHSRIDERSLESLCAELEITPHQLNRLIREHSNISASELLDGFRVRKLRKAMFECLREAAAELWGRPGTHAWTLLSVQNSEFKIQNCGYLDSPLPDREDRALELHRRTSELATKLREDFYAQTWAVALGFASRARLNRAIQHVFGMNLKQFERILACDVVRYYMACEDKVLREAACRDEEDFTTMRARHLYCKSDLKPDEPFLDEYSKAEAFAQEWLEWMKTAFG
ncbi:MAG TPA: hypothetical protein VEJ63_02540 [Planctomycetota bacterium]|nr:hypothetical protein [Planctomycetota bacterium]